MTQSPPPASLKDLTLAELRTKAKLQIDPNQYSAKSWITNATKSAEEAAIAEQEDRPEEAFVKYVKACGFFQLFLGHQDYPKIKGEGAKNPLWHDYVNFSPKQSQYLNKGKILAEQLKLRSIESGTPNGASSAPMAAAPMSSTKPSDGPDISAGGSIAARMAALRGAGMQVQTNAKRGSQDATGSGLQTPNTASSGYTATSNGSRTPTTGGTFSNGSGGLQEPTGSRRGSVVALQSPQTPSTQLDANKTGSSFTSIKSIGLSSRLNGGFSESSRQDDRAMTPQASGSGSRTPTAPSPQIAPRPLPTVPTVSSHHHKASLPNMPAFSSGYNSNNSKPSGMPYDDVSALSGSNAYRQAPGSAGPSRKNSVSEQDDDMAHFSSQFPSLADFEHKPDFAMPTYNPPSLNGDRPGFSRQKSGPSRPDTITEGQEDETDLPKLPSPPKGFPTVDNSLRTNGSNGISAGSSSLSIPDMPPRPSSLPMPDMNDLALKGDVSGASSPIMKAGPPPVAPKPLPKPASLSATAQVKPNLPFTNAIMPSTLKQYLSNPTLKLLLIDTRSYEEHKSGWIQQGELENGSSCVWVDPTILRRQGMDSQKLENALTLQPSSEQRAFERRKDYDLVVIYDSNSRSFPAKGADPTAPASLFSVIFEKEFSSSKTLARSPVLLVGGYQAWVSESGQSSGSTRSHDDYNQLSKSSAPMLPIRKPSLPLPGATPLSPDPNRIRRETGVYRSSAYSRDITENFASSHPQSMAGYTGAYNGQPLIPSHLPTGSSRYSSNYSSSPDGGPKPPPPVSANASPGPLSRRRSDYLEQHNQPYTGYMDRSSRPSTVTYPNLSQPQMPPPAASSGSSRQETRPQPPRSESIISFDGLSKLPDQDDMLYWSDVALGISGLKNLGNTCYMNSTLQCLSATYPLARFFRDGSFKRAINTVNPLGTKGELAKAFSTLVSMLWQESYTFLSPITFRKSISTFAPTFAGTEQQDSQEFLSFLLDGLHEDLNRVKQRPPPVEMTPEREAALETLPPSVAAAKEWSIYKQRNNSFVVDLFQGQYRNRLECMTCHKTSTTYDSFMYLSLPLPSQKSQISVYELIDDFTKTEILDGENAWHCSRCKKPRRATKTLSIARLPPVLLIHFKRFMARQGGLFFDKSETPVIFPATPQTPLDLTRWMPQDPPGTGRPSDPMQMRGPYRYELFAVSNHMGNLSNGHYTAFVKSAKGSGDKNWMYCDDSKVTQHTVNDVVSRPDRAYILFYKRMQ